MQALILLLGGLFGRLVGTGLVRYLATKALLLFLVTVILPAVLLKLWFVIKLASLYITTSFVADYVLAAFHLEDGMLKLTGLAGYLGSELRLAEGVSILISCAILGWCLNFIKG